MSVLAVWKDGRSPWARRAEGTLELLCHVAERLMNSINAIDWRMEIGHNNKITLAFPGTDVEYTNHGICFLGATIELDENGHPTNPGQVKGEFVDLHPKQYDESTAADDRRYRKENTYCGFVFVGHGAHAELATVCNEVCILYLQKNHTYVSKSGRLPRLCCKPKESVWK